ncbi:MAG: hypothetical protein JSR53_00315 [Proteobacteria bacterium]|nr:hypothetical protein [Pseudomonadota bacterium]
MIIGADHALAQLAATIAFADAGAQPSAIRLYADAAAASGATPAGAPLAEVLLAKPCGAIAAGQLTLLVATPAGSTVLATGQPRAAQWVNGAGKLVAAGSVTDVDHAGDFRIGGAPTAPGDDTPQLYAGGLVLLGAVVLG